MHNCYFKSLHKFIYTAAVAVAFIFVTPGCKDAGFTGSSRKATSTKTPAKNSDSKDGDPSSHPNDSDTDVVPPSDNNLDNGDGQSDKSSKPEDLASDDGHYDPSYALCTRFQPTGSGVLKMLKAFYERQECASEKNSFVSYVKNPAYSAQTRGISGCFFASASKHAFNNLKGRWFIAIEEGASPESQMNLGNYSVPSIQSIGTNPNKISFPVSESCFNTYMNP